MDTRPRYQMNKMATLVMAMFHLGAITALFFPTTGRIALFFSVWAVVSSVGIGVCYHRLLTHQGFKTYKWLEYVLAVIAALAQQGLAVMWVAIHRVHHKHTEVPGLDPHTPRDGRWWSHMDWMIHPDPKLNDKTYLLKWVPDLVRQPFYRKRYVEWAPSLVLGLLCWYFGGFIAVLWGVALPVVVGWHQTWLVNSATHIWGSRRFNTDDDSRNLWWVAILSWGEGWHNNHHRWPVNARHGLRWYEVDVNWYLIWLMGKLRLAWGIKNQAH
jgi:fatty-acid desaturase